MEHRGRPDHCRPRRTFTLLFSTRAFSARSRRYRMISDVGALQSPCPPFGVIGRYRNSTDVPAARPVIVVLPCSSSAATCSRSPT
ncbi:MAG TPA: hypothetical protein VIY73_07870 [Polyangiaceae bacterium]